MKKTYKNQLPYNMEVKSTNVRIGGREIFIDVELEEKYIPKDGDFLYKEPSIVVIYKETDTEGAIISYAGGGKNVTTLETRNGWGYTRDFRLATPEEKEDFLDMLKNKYNIRWNAKKKCLEDIPKFGDIVKVISSWGSVRNYMICIMPDKDIPEEDTSAFYDIYNIDKGCRLTSCCGYTINQETVPASESEKQELFDKLAEVGKKWNSETKQLEDIRWRAKEGNYYYTIDMYGSIVKALDFETAQDTCLYNYGNYFQTEEEAEVVKSKLYSIFKEVK